MIDSKPLTEVKQGENLRFISSLYKKKLYGKYTRLSTNANKYKYNEEIAIRNFIKGLLMTPPKFNLQRGVLFDRQSIVDFVNGYNPGRKYSVESISRYKHRDVQMVKIQKSAETEAFVTYVKTKFKDFDTESFYG